MQKWCFDFGAFISITSILTLSGLLLLFSGCRNDGESQKNNQTSRNPDQITGNINPPVYAKHSSFQNSDSTWGFTIFVNSKPYLLYKRIPVPDAVSGFSSKKEAESVAVFFVKMIRKGNLSPELNLKTLDSLRMVMNKNE